MANKLVFTDESGTWSSNGGFYVRAWVICDPARHASSQALITSNLKHAISWKDGKIGGTHADSIELLHNELNPEVYITFTANDEFQDRKLNVRDDVTNLLLDHKSLSGKNYKEALIKQVTKSVNLVYFLNLYESFHWDNLLGCLSAENSYLISVDTPSQFGKDTYSNYIEAVKEKHPEKNFTYSFVKDSEKSIGIQFADLYAGIVRSLLASEHTRAADAFEKYLKPNLISITHPISKVFWNSNDGDQPYWSRMA